VEFKNIGTRLDASINACLHQYSEPRENTDSATGLDGGFFDGYTLQLNITLSGKFNLPSSPGTQAELDKRLGQMYVV